MSAVSGNGTREDPWVLTAPAARRSSRPTATPDADHRRWWFRSGQTQLSYQLRCIEDLHAWLEELGEWVPLGDADEQKPAKPRAPSGLGGSADNPVGGWYGVKKGLRGRFGMYVPPCSRSSVSPRSSTTPATTACGRTDDPPEQGLPSRRQHTGSALDNMAGW